MPEGPEKVLLFRKIIVAEQGNPKLFDCLFKVEADGPNGIIFEHDEKFNVIYNGINSQEVKQLIKKAYSDAIYKYNQLPDINVFDVVRHEPMDKITLAKANAYIYEADRKRGLEKNETFGQMFVVNVRALMPMLEQVNFHLEDVSKLL